MNIKIAELLPLATEYKPNINKTLKALKEAYRINKKDTLQMLLYIRDKNNGAGRRDFTRTALLWLKVRDEEVFNANIINFLLVGRWDDIFFSTDIINEHTLEIIKAHLESGDTLLKKWLPKEASNPDVARMIAKGIGLTMKEYRLSIKRNEGEFINTLFRPIAHYNVNV